MEALTLKMTAHESAIIPAQDNDSVRKQLKQGPSPTKQALLRNEQISNTGTDYPIPKPPDPSLITPAMDQQHVHLSSDTEELNNSMETAESKINGGITDADLSTTIMQDDAPISPIYWSGSPIDATSPMAEDTDNDL